MSARRRLRADLPVQQPLPLRPKGGARVIAVASGKGGVGKSFFSAGLCWALARAGSRVIAVDADFGGPNLHTCLGVRAAETPGLAALEGGRPLESVLAPTGLANLQLVCGTAEPLHAPNLRANAWSAALARLQGSGAQFVILDLGAGSSYLTVDLFLSAAQGILVTTPEPTAMENAYRFLKTLFFRFAATRAPSDRIRRLVSESLYAESSSGQVRSPVALLSAISAGHAGLGAELEAALARLDLSILVNQTRCEADTALPRAMAAAARKVFALPCRPFGWIPFDAEVIRAVRERKPFLSVAAQSAAAGAIERLAADLRAAHPSGDAGRSAP